MATRGGAISLAGRGLALRLPGEATRGPRMQRLLPARRLASPEGIFGARQLALSRFSYTALGRVAAAKHTDTEMTWTATETEDTERRAWRRAWRPQGNACSCGEPLRGCTPASSLSASLASCAISHPAPSSWAFAPLAASSLWSPSRLSSLVLHFRSLSAVASCSSSLHRAYPTSADFASSSSLRSVASLLPLCPASPLASASRSACNSSRPVCAFAGLSVPPHPCDTPAARRASFAFISSFASSRLAETERSERECSGRRLREGERKVFHSEETPQSRGRLGEREGGIVRERETDREADREARRKERDEREGRGNGSPAGVRSILSPRAQIQASLCLANGVCVIEPSVNPASSSPSPSSSPLSSPSSLSPAPSSERPCTSSSSRVEHSSFSAKDKQFHCHYSSLSRYELATELQLPYSDIRLLDVVRVPSSLKLPHSSSLSSLSSFSPFSPGSFSPRSRAAADGALLTGTPGLEKTVHTSSRSDEEKENSTAGRSLFASFFSFFSSPVATGEKREQTRSAHGGSRARRDFFAGQPESPREEEPLSLPFLPAGLDALKLQHAKILVRRTAILVQIENIGAVITPHKMILLHPHPSVTSALLHQLTCGEATPQATASLLECGNASREERDDVTETSSSEEPPSPASKPSLSSAGGPRAWCADTPRQLPFELRALEALFAVALGSLDAVAKDYVDRVRLTIATLEQESSGVSRNSRRSASSAWSLATADATLFTLVHSPSLHQLMVLKNLLQDIEARLEAFRGCLSKLLSDDGDMADMYLTDRLVYTIPHAREDHADVELLLEGCLQQVDELQYDILTAKRCVIHHEELTKMHLDVCRNAYMQMNVKISLFSLTTSVAAVIAGIFGMNLPLFESPQPDPVPRQEPFVSSASARSLSDRGEEQPGGECAPPVARTNANIEVAGGNAQAAPSPQESKQGVPASPVSPLSPSQSAVERPSGSRSGVECGDPASGRGNLPRGEAVGESDHAPSVNASSPSATLSGWPSRQQQLWGAFCSSVFASPLGSFSLAFPRTLWHGAAVEEWKQVLLARSRAFSRWVFDHSFFLVSGLVILPTCACGFVFCNRLARIFALHGCSSEKAGAGRGQLRRAAAVRNVLAFLARTKGETSAYAFSRKKLAQRPRFFFPSLFSFNRHAARNMPFPPASEMPRPRQDRNRNGL
uniref:CorA-like Mg2 transporter domain-containing protein, putative n=1 Tax=Neospora caninum (strain Liverpool) TaxID=572307 RepID=A0A0F7UJR2_NEOCL|nr:TPA: corA-like Mg2 transporter domain-containing protein, putative [Neospora caninum Liverpool]